MGFNSGFKGLILLSPFVSAPNFQFFILPFPFFPSYFPFQFAFTFPSLMAHVTNMYVPSEFITLMNIHAAFWNIIPCGLTLTFKNRASYIQDGRTATLQMLHFIYIFSTNISTEYFKHAARTLFFSSKCRLFHNATLFGSSIIHILHTGCVKI